MAKSEYNIREELKHAKQLVNERYNHCQSQRQAVDEAINAVNKTLRYKAQELQKVDKDKFPDTYENAIQELRKDINWWNAVLKELYGMLK